MEGNKKEKRKSSKLKIALVSIFSIVLLLVLGTSTVLIVIITYSNCYKIPTQADYKTSSSDLVFVGKDKSSSRSLYDPSGNRLVLKGVNVGQLLLQEGWMSPFSGDPLYDEDGKLVKDNDGNIQYPEYSEEDFLNDLYSNPNLKDDAEELIDYYRSCFFNEEDFKIIKEVMKLNCIRLPFYWRNILNDDFSKKEEKEAFEYLDWFIEKCKENELYVILDLHGAPGSQNGFEHSGYIVDKPELWGNDIYENATINLWDYVSNHYTNTRPDLASTIATYDILNEPQEDKSRNGGTTEYIGKFYDKIYDEIRNNNDDHVINFEFIWDFGKFIDPNKYGWENVMYGNHHYNFGGFPFSLYRSYHDSTHMFTDFEVPIIISEFSYFEDKDVWLEALIEWYDYNGWSWTFWNYKTTIIGWRGSSWGYLNCNIIKDIENEETKCNVKTCTKEEFIKNCDALKTENCTYGPLKDILDSYHNYYLENPSD